MLKLNIQKAKIMASDPITSWQIDGETVTNLDSILKSRDITLLTKVRLVKAMVFPVVMYGCESWTIKKAECQRIVLFCFCPLFFLPSLSGWLARLALGQSWCLS